MHQPDPSSTPKPDPQRQDHNGRKMLFDFGPLLLFFGTNYIYSDLMLSVKVLVAATLVSLALSWHFDRQISMMAAVGCAALVFFAGLTLYFDNELFIKIKPTVVTLLFAALIAGGRLLGRNPLAAIIGKQINCLVKSKSKSNKHNFCVCINYYCYHYCDNPTILDINF